MNKLKRSLLYCLSMLLAFSFLISPFPKKTTSSANAADPNVTDIQLLDKNVLNYVSISTAGLALTEEKLKSVDSDGDGKNDTSYIVAKGTISLNFKPFEYNYAFTTISDSLYYKSSITKTIEADGEGKFPETFEYGDKTITYKKSADNKYSFTIKNEDSSTTTVNDEFSDLINVDISNEASGQISFEFITGYTLKADSPNTNLSFYIKNQTNQTNQTKYTQYTLNFERPISDFKTDYVTYFTCKDLESGDVNFNNIIERELTYENVKLQFTNNNYTKNNPLYFDINYNGFVYTFILYSENIGGSDLLFVEYFDDQRSQNNRSLASVLNADGTAATKSVPKYKTGSLTDFNFFSIEFNQTGRYEISVYDSTYLLLKNQPYTVTPEDDDPTDDIEPEPEVIIPEDNQFNYNFYKTSFYINTNTQGDLGDKAFKNAYVILQSYDDNGNYLDYIVSRSYQNNNVEITLKNLAYYFENDPIIKDFQSTEEVPDLEVVQFIKTKFGIENIPEPRYYTLSELKTALEKDEDFTINCTDDAFYEIIIYKFDENYKKINQTSYQFTIVKKPKLSFTVFEVDENNDPIEDPTKFPVEYKKITREGEIPYETVEETYKMNINSSMKILPFFCEKLIPECAVGDLPVLDEDDIVELPKTYLNEYVINLAMQQVTVEKVDVPDPDDSSKTLKVLGLQFFGIGEITVTITVNSTTTTHIVASGDVLQFEAYGIYHVSIVDSMGAVDSQVFNYSKPVSLSSLLLIGLCGLIVLAIVLIVVSSRGKLKTR